jgi:hypothetical protein
MLSNAEDYKQLEARYNALLDEIRALGVQHEQEQDPGERKRIASEFNAKRAEAEPLYKELTDFRSQLASRPVASL